MSKNVKIINPIDTRTFKVQGSLKNLEDILLLWDTYVEGSGIVYISKKVKLIHPLPEGGEPQEEAEILITCEVDRYDEILEDIRNASFDLVII